MVVFLVSIALMLNYGFETARNRGIREARDPDRRNATLLENQLANGLPVSDAVEAARRRLFAPSDDPLIETQRRVTLAAFLAFAAWIPFWFVSGESVDRLILAAATVQPAWALVLCLLIVVEFASGRTIVVSLVGPIRAPRRAMFALGAFAIALWVIQLTASSLGLT